MRYLLLPLFLCACFEADQHIAKEADIAKCRVEAERSAPLKPSETGNDLNADLRKTLITTCLEEKGYTLNSEGQLQ